MGSFVVYALEWAMCLSAFLFLYKMCFSGCTFHRFNRAFLLGSVVLSALLPLIHISTNEQIEPIAEMCRVNTEHLEPLPVVSQLSETNEQFSAFSSPLGQGTLAGQELSTSQKVFLFIAITYLLYVAIQTIG